MIISKYILQILESQERPRVWLAEKIDISRQSIRYKFNNNGFTADDLVKIAIVLNIDLEELKKEYQNNNDKMEE